MANLLAEKHNTFWHDYEVFVAAGASAGIGLKALPPVSANRVTSSTSSFRILHYAV